MTAASPATGGGVVFLHGEAAGPPGSDTNSGAATAPLPTFGSSIAATETPTTTEQNTETKADQDLKARSFRRHRRRRRREQERERWDGLG